MACAQKKDFRMFPSINNFESNFKRVNVCDAKTIESAKNFEIPKNFDRDLYFLIFQYLHLHDLVNVTQVSHEFYQIGNNPNLWKLLFSAMIGVHLPQPLENELPGIYKASTKLYVAAVDVFRKDTIVIGARIFRNLFNSALLEKNLYVLKLLSDELAGSQISKCEKSTYVYHLTDDICDPLSICLKKVAFQSETDQAKDIAVLKIIFSGLNNLYWCHNSMKGLKKPIDCFKFESLMRQIVVISVEKKDSDLMFWIIENNGIVCENLMNEIKTILAIHIKEYNQEKIDYLLQLTSKFWPSSDRTEYFQSWLEFVVENYKPNDAKKFIEFMRNFDCSEYGERIFQCFNKAILKGNLEAAESLYQLSKMSVRTEITQQDLLDIQQLLFDIEKVLFDCLTENVHQKAIKYLDSRIQKPSNNITVEGFEDFIMVNPPKEELSPKSKKKRHCTIF